MLRWAATVGLETPGSFEAFVEAVERRGAVKAVLAAEGLQPLYAAASPLPVIDLRPEPVSYPAIHEHGDRQ